MKFNSRTFVIVLSFLAAAAIVYYFSDLVAYVVVAWVLSMIGQPLMDFLKRYMNKNLAALLTLVSFIILFTGLIYIFIPPLVKQARNLTEVDYEKVINSLEDPINDWNDWLIRRGLIEGDTISIDSLGMTNDVVVQEDTISVVPNEQGQMISHLVHIDSVLSNQGDTFARTNVALWINIQHPGKEAENEVKEKPVELLKKESFFERLKKNVFTSLNPAKIPELFGSVISMVGNILIAIMSILFIAFFFLKEEGLFLAFLSAITPSGTEDKVAHALDETSKLLIRYFIGVATQVSIITIFVSMALTLFGVKNALLIGFFAALMNVIPYIGPIIGASFGLIITLSSNLELEFYTELVPLLLIVLAVFGLMQVLDNLLLQPKIFSRSVKAHPLEIFIVIMVGAKLGGILGMVLAIPAYTVFRVIAKVFLSEFKIVKKLTGSI